MNLQPRILPANFTLEQPPDTHSLAISVNAAFVFVGVYSLLGLWVPYSVFTGVAGASYIPEFWLAIAILEYSAIRLSMLAAAGKPHFLALTFFFFTYTWIGLAGALQISVWRFPWFLRHNVDDLTPALVLVATALVCYDIGRWWYTPAGQMRDFPSPRFAFRVTPRRIITICLISVPAAAYGLFYFGGLEHLLGSRATFATGLQPGSTKMGTLLAKMLLRAPSFVALMLCAYYVRVNWPEMGLHKKRFYLALLLGLVAFNLVTNYPLAQARYWLGTIILTPLFAFIPWRKRHMSLWVLFLTFATVWVFPRADVFRRSETISEAVDRLRSGQSTVEQLMSADYDVFQMTLNSAVYAEENELWLGKNFLGAMLFWYPRAMWHDKPYGSGMTVAAGLRYRYTNLSAPLWIEPYLSFSWPGVVLFFLVYGYFSGWCDLRYTQNLARASLTSIIGIAVPFWAAYQTIFLRGDLHNTVAHSFLVLVLFAFAANLKRSRVSPANG